MTQDYLSTGRQRILEQAQHLFSLHGYHGASIRDIAQACGLSNASLYYYFGNKQNLYLEVLKEYNVVVAQKLQQTGAGEGSCRDRLARMVHAYAQIIVESQGEIQTLLRDLSQFDQEDIRHLLPDMRRRIQSTIATVLEEGVVAGEIRPVDTYRVGILLLGMVSSLVARRLYSLVAATLEEDVDLVVNVLFEGIGV
jgi:AcrR family transcriptional regulator